MTQKSQCDYDDERGDILKTLVFLLLAITVLIKTDPKALIFSKGISL